MNKFFAFVLSVFIVVPAVRPVYAENPQQAQIAPPDVLAQSAVLIERQTGKVVWGKNEREPNSMASTTKIMTAMLAIESGTLDETCTASHRAAAAPSVKMGLAAGEQILMSDLMYALLLESQNDAAVAIAEHVGGSVENFCAAMTAKAKEIGASNTLFVTPNGLDEGNHHSTAYDMALIARYALANPLFLEISNTASKSFSSNMRSYSFSNKNKFLDEYAGAYGVKTGYTKKAGHCFVGAAKRGGIDLISVVLVSDNDGKWADTRAVLDYGFALVAAEEAQKRIPADDVSIIYAGKAIPFEAPPFMQGGYLYIQACPMLDAMGVDCEYHENGSGPVADKWLAAQRGGISVEFRAGDGGISAPFGKYEGEPPCPKYFGDRFYIPIAYVTDVFGAARVWDEAGKTVVVTG